MRRKGWGVAVSVVLVTLALMAGVVNHQQGSRPALIRHAAPGLPPTATDDRLTTSGASLVRDGYATHVVGINAYSATTWFGTNWGCGSPIYDLPRLFAQVPIGGLVRVWAFQALGWNNKVTPGRIDFFGIDRVVAAAAAAHRQLILTLSDQAGVCDDGHWHDQAWYDGGYRSARSDDDGRGLGNLSYLAWVRTIVARYAGNPAVAVWEPVNEPEASDCTGATGAGCEDAARRSCPSGAARSMTSFFTAVGGVIHGLDPHALVSEGVSGGGQCGLAGDDFATVGASRGVDLLTYHDYGDESTPLPSGLSDRLAQARFLHKPLLVEEAGINGGASCTSLVARAAAVGVKARAALTAGAVGWLPWWFDESGPDGCGQDYGPGDPALETLSTISAAALRAQRHRLPAGAN